MSVRVKIQKFGSKLSSMVIPNLGAFIAWGLLTAVGIAIDNDMLRSFITPMLNYLLPLLIAFAGGKMVYDYRGGVLKRDDVHWRDDPRPAVRMDPQAV